MLVTLFSTSVHSVGLKCIVFLTFCRVAKLALDKICFKKSLYFPCYFTIFPILALYFWKIVPTLSPIFLLETTWSPAFLFRFLVGIFLNTLMCTLPHPVLKNHFPFQNVKCQKWKAAVLEGFRLTCLLDSAHAKPNDWRNCWNKLSIG